MSQSLALLLVHVIFSTKDRAPFLRRELRSELHAYLATVTRNLGCECFLVGGVEDHVHLAVGLSRTLTAAKLVEQLKTASSHWIKTESPDLHRFSWQSGYAMFSVSPQALPELKAYIADQEAHHHRASFQDELRRLLTKYEVAFDERYLWD
jgi:REP element-mobilizing transposase RayT